MGAIAQVQQQAAVTNASESFTLVVLILGTLFTLIGGSYLFSWMNSRDLWKAINHMKEVIGVIKDNDIRHIEERLTKLEK